MAQLTAVEWLVKMLYSPVCKGFIEGRRPIPHDIIEQAKAMDKQQKKDDFNAGYRQAEEDNGIDGVIDISEYDNAEQYYNETYKNK